MMARAAILLAAALVASSCGARLTVTKVDPGDTTTPGVRYALPKPFLRVTPLADGTAEVDVVCLPDGDNTYAIEAHDTLGAHNLRVSVSGGLLQAVAWSASAAAVGEHLAAQTARAASAAGRLSKSTCSVTTLVSEPCASIGRTSS